LIDERRSSKSRDNLKNKKTATQGLIVTGPLLARKTGVRTKWLRLICKALAPRKSETARKGQGQGHRVGHVRERGKLTARSRGGDRGKTTQSDQNTHV